MRDPHGGGSCLGDGKGEVCILCRCLGLEEGSNEGLLGWDSYLHGEHMEGGFLSWESVGAEVSCALQGTSHFWKASCGESRAVLPDSFAHRGREVHWRPSWALLEGVVLSRDSDQVWGWGGVLCKCAWDVPVS
jgi:hypothetical protein